jgi:hypothetical protein
MKFLYPYAHYPDKNVLEPINAAAARLFPALSRLDVNTLDISDYSKKYLAKYVRNPRNTLQRYSYILSLATACSPVPLDHCVFVEYGGGTGIMSLLAKELKIGTVIYNDIYDVSCSDARIIGEALENQADYYVSGDLDDIITFLRKNSLSCDAIASYDVLEHIYDVELFLKTLPHLSEKGLTVAMSSGANAANPFIRKSLVKRQLNVEYKDREKEWGHKERDSLRAYFSIRKEIISSHYQLTEREVDQLARATRGMIESDIRTCVDTYVKTHTFPPELSHPTNTCDPYTGNWAEHVMDPYSLARILSECGFETAVLTGYYGRYSQGALRIGTTLLDLSISLLGRYGITVAPFYTVYGRTAV